MAFSVFILLYDSCFYLFWTVNKLHNHLHNICRLHDTSVQFTVPPGRIWETSGKEQANFHVKVHNRIHIHTPGKFLCPIGLLLRWDCYSVLNNISGWEIKSYFQNDFLFSLRVLINIFALHNIPNLRAGGTAADLSPGVQPKISSNKVKPE